MFSLSNEFCHHFFIRKSIILHYASYTVAIKSAFYQFSQSAGMVTGFLSNTFLCLIYFNMFKSTKFCKLSYVICVEKAEINRFGLGLVMFLFDDFLVMI